jgi:ABC-type ATPase with predicted acetyltransferase domain
MIIIIFMSVPNIIVVAGSSGAGKTTWVCQQMRDTAAVEQIIYYSPGTGTVPVDQNRIASEFPGMQVFGDCLLYTSDAADDTR